MKHANALDVELDGTKTGDSTDSGRETFEQRKRFTRFSTDDARLLAELHETFERHADEIVTPSSSTLRRSIRSSRSRPTPTRFTASNRHSETISSA